MDPQPYHVEKIPVENLVLSEENVRQDAGDVTGLKDSIKEQGVLEPLTARPRSDGRYEVYIGGRRLAAAKLLGLQTLPVKIEETSDSDAVIRSLAENLQRKDLTPEQRATAYLRLQQLDPKRFSTRGLAKVTGVSQARIVQELQAYDVQLHLRPHGIEVISGLSPSRREKAEGTSLPEYHATLLHQAINEAKDDLTDQQLADVYPGLARAIAPLNRSQAKQVLAQFRQSPNNPIPETVAVALEEERPVSNESVTTMQPVVDYLPEETADEPGDSGFRKHDQQAITNNDDGEINTAIAEPGLPAFVLESQATADSGATLEAASMPEAAVPAEPSPMTRFNVDLSAKFSIDLLPGQWIGLVDAAEANPDLGQDELALSAVQVVKDRFVKFGIPWTQMHAETQVTT